MADPYVIVVETQASTPIGIDVINSLTVYGQGGVTSVNGQTGNITITANSIGLGSVDNTPDLAKPISNLTQAALDGKALVNHNHTIANITGLQTALDGKQATGNYVLSNDTRLSDARTPLAHTHAIGEVTGLQTALDGKLSITSANATFQPISGMSVYLTANLAATTYQTIANNTFANLSGKPTTLAGYGITDGLTSSTAASTYAPISTTVTLTGTQTVQTKQLQSWRETFTTPAISSGTLTLDLSGSNFFKVSLNAAITTLTISNTPSGAAASFTLEFTADGTARAVTWPTAVKWPGGTAPTLTSTLNKTDTFVFYTTDGGSTWKAFITGQNS